MVSYCTPAHPTQISFFSDFSVHFVVPFQPMGALKTEGWFWRIFRLKEQSARQSSSKCTRWGTDEEGSLLDGDGTEAARGRSSSNISVRTAYLCLQDMNMCRPRGKVSVEGHMCVAAVAHFRRHTSRTSMTRAH